MILKPEYQILKYLWKAYELRTANYYETGNRTCSFRILWMSKIKLYVPLNTRVGFLK